MLDSGQEAQTEKTKYVPRHTFITPNTRIRYSPSCNTPAAPRIGYPKRVMKGIMNIPCLHIGSRMGSEGSKTANSSHRTGPTRNESCMHYMYGKQPTGIIQYDAMDENDTPVASSADVISHKKQNSSPVANNDDEVISQKKQKTGLKFGLVGHHGPSYGITLPNNYQREPTNIVAQCSCFWFIDCLLSYLFEEDKNSRRRIMVMFSYGYVRKKPSHYAVNLFGTGLGILLGYQISSYAFRGLTDERSAMIVNVIAAFIVALIGFFLSRRLLRNMLRDDSGFIDGIIVAYFGIANAENADFSVAIVIFIVLLQVHRNNIERYSALVQRYILGAG
ncbi:hypothetical protein IFM89_039923 [Coptis chinensis]|uniref:Uncharacterized protein n=1 Tax=Coptis chinensis TaxID=261450 RepID=A0A835LGV0_9MAGN|nr:hypothetical protein IFM89_039923 [Coptis chinensis]